MSYDLSEASGLLLTKISFDCVFFYIWEVNTDRHLPNRSNRVISVEATLSVWFSGPQGSRAPFIFVLWGLSQFIFSVVEAPQRAWKYFACKWERDHPGRRWLRKCSFDHHRTWWLDLLNRQFSLLLDLFEILCLTPPTPLAVLQVAASKAAVRRPDRGGGTEAEGHLWLFVGFPRHRCWLGNAVRSLSANSRKPALCPFKPLSPQRHCSMWGQERLWLQS